MASGDVRNPSPLQAVPPINDFIDDSEETAMETSHIVVDDALSDETTVDPRGVGGSKPVFPQSTRLEIVGANSFCRDPNKDEILFLTILILVCI